MARWGGTLHFRQYVGRKMFNALTHFTSQRNTTKTAVHDYTED
jgi:hypothetical protein